MPAGRPIGGLPVRGVFLRGRPRCLWQRGFFCAMSRFARVGGSAPFTGLRPMVGEGPQPRRQAWLTNARQPSALKPWSRATNAGSFLARGLGTRRESDCFSKGSFSPKKRLWLPLAATKRRRAFQRQHAMACGKWRGSSLPICVGAKDSPYY